MADDWKKSWKNSTQPKKQRKYRRNAPYHHRNKFLSAPLADDLRDRIGTRSLPVREGDEAEITRGDWEGLSGQVSRVDHQEYKVYMEGIDRERVDSTDAKMAIDPSNIRLTKLELDDERRLAKFEVSDEDREAIKVDEDQDAQTSSSEDEEKEALEEAEDLDEPEESESKADENDEPEETDADEPEKTDSADAEAEEEPDADDEEETDTDEDEGEKK